MRKQFVQTTEDVLAKDPRTVLLLGDIGVFGFRKAFEAFPDRVYNIGILEQSTIGTAAGLAMADLIPVVHTIAPFIVERAFEQLKDDFAFQKLGGNFVSVGASYDYAALGATHHCPGDVGALKNIPGMEIVVPGHSEEYDSLFRQAYANGHPTYFRLSERENPFSVKVSFGKASVIKKGKRATVIAVGPILGRVLEACANEDVTILYYTTLAPFDRETLKKNSLSGNILVCEPYYAGALAWDIAETFAGKPIRLRFAGMPHEFLSHYGKDSEHDEFLGLTAKGIRKELKLLLK